MNKNYDYNYDEEHKVLIKNYYGTITLEDIINSWRFAFENDLIIKGCKGCILDYRNAEMNIEAKVSKQISSFYRENISYFKNQKIAILTNKPHDTMVSMLFRREDIGYESRPFSTFKAALDWITR